MTKQPLATLVTEDKENPIKATKSIKSFFTTKRSPKRTNSLRDITPTIVHADEQTKNTPPPNSTQNGVKRSFSANEGSESIAVKRARRFFASDEKEVVASPFFSRNDHVTVLPISTVKERRSTSVFETIDTQSTDGSLIVNPARSTPDQPAENNIESPGAVVENVEDELQVSESPPQTKEKVPLEPHSDEVVLDSPTCNRTDDRLDTQTTEEEIGECNVPNSPCQEPNVKVFPLSPPPSRPTSAIFLPRPSHPSQSTPIMHPGIRKAFTPRPSHNVFPDTPIASPTLSPHQSLVVKGWKERFFHNSASSSPGLFTPKGNDSPKIGNSMSARPMTPLHTPLLRRNPPNKPSETNVPVKFGRSRIIGDQIEDPVDNGGSPNLDRFRFLG
jgi:hypothetical protein